MSQHKTGYVISYHGILCHDMSYVTTIAASLISSDLSCKFVYKRDDRPSTIVILEHNFEHNR